MSASSEILTPHPPFPPPGECVLPPFGAEEGHTRWVERGWGVNSSEDARHCSLLYICKYFVGLTNSVFVISERLDRKRQNVISQAHHRVLTPPPCHISAGKAGRNHLKE